MPVNVLLNNCYQNNTSLSLLVGTTVAHGIPMEFPVQINTKKLELLIMNFKGSGAQKLNLFFLQSLKIAFRFGNSADLDEMPCYVAFHLNFHCFSKCPFICLIDFILYVPSTIFQLYRDWSSWVEPVLS